MTQPNIILILADDMGFSDIGCYGGEIETPNLDALGTGGVRFAQMYNAARCCCSRASLLSGLYPHQAGVGHLAYDLGHPAFRGRLADHAACIAEVLLDAGYHTGLCGKWHVAGRSLDPADERLGRGGNYPLANERGFERWFGTVGGSTSFFHPHDLVRDGEPVSTPEGFYYTDAISDEACAMVDDWSTGERPFFLYLAYTAPHWPLHAHEGDIEVSRGRFVKGWDKLRPERLERLRDMGLLDRRWPLSMRDELAPPWDEIGDRDWQDLRMAVYAAQIAAMDRGIGRVVEALRARGQLDNTLIMFLSDNGGCAELLREDGILDPFLATTPDGRGVRLGNTPDIAPGADDTYASYGLPWANLSDAPFRLYKHWVHEGGIATPFIAHWPDAIVPGRIEHGPAHLVDITATIADVAGVPWPNEIGHREILPPEGESMADALRGATWQRQRPICWEHEGNRAVRDAELKLVSRHPGQWELYNMDQDRTELCDLSGRYPNTVARLAATYRDWAARCKVPDWSAISKLEQARVRAYENRLGGRRAWATSRNVW